jgi:hypothetical protein
MNAINHKYLLNLNSTRKIHTIAPKNPKTTRKLKEPKVKVFKEPKVPKTPKVKVPKITKVKEPKALKKPKTSKAAFNAKKTTPKISVIPQKAYVAEHQQPPETIKVPIPVRSVNLIISNKTLPRTTKIPVSKIDIKKLFVTPKRYNGPSYLTSNIVKPTAYQSTRYNNYQFKLNKNKRLLKLNNVGALVPIRGISSKSNYTSIIRKKLKVKPLSLNAQINNVNADKAPKVVKVTPKVRPKSKKQKKSSSKFTFLYTLIKSIKKLNNKSSIIKKPWSYSSKRSLGLGYPYPAKIKKIETLGLIEKLKMVKIQKNVIQKIVRDIKIRKRPRRRLKTRRKRRSRRTRSLLRFMKQKIDTKR